MKGRNSAQTGTTVARFCHACGLCGGSCHGVRVRLIEGERARLETQARELDVEDPMVDGHLRQEEGRCVFLDADERCRIHSRWGAEAKPHVCRQYPFVRLRTAEGTREGIDPGCYRLFPSIGVGDPVDEESIPLDAPLPAELAAPEAGVLAVLERTHQAGRALAVLTRSDPEALFARWEAHLQSTALEPLSRASDAGPMLGRSLAPLFAEERDDATFGEARQQWALEAARRCVHLRLLRRTLPFPPAAAVVVVLGAWSLAERTASDTAFGAGVAGWTRALRAPVFVRTLFADAQALGRVIGG